MGAPLEVPVRLLDIFHAYSPYWACRCRARFAGIGDWPSVSLCLETNEFVEGRFEDGGKEIGGVEVSHCYYFGDGCGWMDDEGRYRGIGILRKN